MFFDRKTYFINDQNAKLASKILSSALLIFIVFFTCEIASPESHNCFGHYIKQTLMTYNVCDVPSEAVM